MKIKFCGAAREVTGSAHLITLDDGFTFLLDCGLYQGYDKEMENFNRTWLFEPQHLDAVILSHGHIDHIGKLPILVKDGFAKTIYCTHATRSLASILLTDSAMIQERDAQYAAKKIIEKGYDYDKNVVEPLYLPQDIPPVLNKMQSFPYDVWINLNSNVSFMYKDAGHILGSASINLKINEKGIEKILVFSGDIGRPNRPILRDPQPMNPANYVICESTYGNRLHQGAPEDLESLLAIIQETCIEKKGKVIIPAFSVGRTQELVYMMDRLATEGRLPEVPVYVDSPLAVNATSIYASHLECYDKDLVKYLLQDPNPFGFDKLKYIKDVNLSKKLNVDSEPCVIISASGMANAGRIQHHIINNCDKKRNTILIVGYCAPGTPGAQLRDGVKELRLHGQTKPVNARIVIMDSFSAHADRDEMTTFLENQKMADRIFLVHGQESTQGEFIQYLGENGFKNVYNPFLGEEIEL